MGKADDIAREADACKDQTLWAHSVEKKSEYNGVVFGRSTPKCNLFVSDMLHRAGITPPTRNDAWRGPITANQWTGSVSGFSKATSQQRGDIVADSKHCGIASNSEYVRCADSLKINFNKKDGNAFTGENKTIQRYDG